MPGCTTHSCSASSACSSRSTISALCISLPHMGQWQPPWGSKGISQKHLRASSSNSCCAQCTTAMNTALHMVRRRSHASACCCAIVRASLTGASESSALPMLPDYVVCSLLMLLRLGLGKHTVHLTAACTACSCQQQGNQPWGRWLGWCCSQATKYSQCKCLSHEVSCTVTTLA